MRKKLLKVWPIIAIFILSFLITWPLLRSGYFSHHDDLQVMRIFEMDKCFSDLQIPCRWVPDMGFGNGFPLYNYYNVFPYYLGAFFSLFFGFIGSAKVLFFLPLLFGGVSMFYLARELFDQESAFLAAILFMFAPYRALDTYVRGDLSESFAIALAPLIFLLFLRLIRQKNLKYLVWSGISLAVLLTSHTIMSIFFGPLLVAWIIFWLVIERSVKNINLLIKTAGAFLLGIGLSAFFTLPAFLEKSYVQIDNLTQGDLDFRAQFVEIKQLFFDRTWGYGASVPGPGDTISFQIGWPHWWIVVVSFGLIVYLIAKKRALKTRMVGLGVFLLLTFALATLMTHNRAAFIWERIGILRFVQFPWRFLSVIIFSASLLGGFVAFYTGKWKKLFVVLVALLTIGLNFSFFKPDIFYPSLTDSQKLSGSLWTDQQKAAINDYLPNGAVTPIEAAPGEPIIRSGSAFVSDFSAHSNAFSFNAQVLAPSVVEVPVFDFPSWVTFINSSQVTHLHNNPLDRITLNLEPGSYLISGKFENTPLRIAANIISVVSLIVAAGLLIYAKNRKISR
jgi:hypothetical protein